MSWLSENFRTIAIAVLEVELEPLEQATIDQLQLWDVALARESLGARDIRLVCESEPMPSPLGGLRVMISPTDNGHAVLYCNLRDGYSALMYQLSRNLDCSIYRFFATLQVTEYPMNYMHILSKGRTRRLVRTMRDERGWDFWQEGPPLYFESQSIYAQRLKRLRLTANMVDEYVGYLGFGSLLALCSDSDSVALYLAQQPDQE